MTGPYSAIGCFYFGYKLCVRPYEPMKRRMKTYLIAMILGMIAAAPALSQTDLAKLSPDEENQVKAGAVVVHMAPGPSRIKRFCIVGNIDAPADVVYQVYSDFDHQKDVFSAYSQATVLARHDNIVDSRLAIDFPWPLGQRWMVNEATTHADERVITSKRLQGNFSAWEDYLKILPVSARQSRVVYEGLVDPNLPLPAWLLNFIQGQTAPTTITDVRDYIARKHLLTR